MLKLPILETEIKNARVVGYHSSKPYSDWVKIVSKNATNCVKMRLLRKAVIKVMPKDKCNSVFLETRVAILI